MLGSVASGWVWGGCGLEGTGAWRGQPERPLLGVSNYEGGKGPGVVCWGLLSW